MFIGYSSNMDLENKKEKIMKNRLGIVTLSFITALTLVSCGGSSDNNGESNDSKTVGGVFLDSAVKGLSYNCDMSNKSGTTDKSGKYTCEKGDKKVTFKIGSTSLGEVAIADVITPASFFSGDNSQLQILNLAQLLQSMDKDNNPDNGIELNPADITKVENSTLDFANSNFDSELSSILGKAIVSELDAQKHINNMFAKQGMPKLTVVSESESSSTNDKPNGNDNKPSGNDDKPDNGKPNKSPYPYQEGTSINLDNIKHGTVIAAFDINNSNNYLSFLLSTSSSATVQYIDKKKGVPHWQVMGGYAYTVDGNTLTFTKQPFAVDAAPNPAPHTVIAEFSQNNVKAHTKITVKFSEKTMTFDVLSASDDGSLEKLIDKIKLKVK